MNESQKKSKTMFKDLKIGDGFRFNLDGNYYDAIKVGSTVAFWIGNSEQHCAPMNPYMSVVCSGRVAISADGVVRVF